MTEKILILTNLCSCGSRYVAGLLSSGLKNVLVERLREHLRDDGVFVEDVAEGSGGDDIGFELFESKDSVIASPLDSKRL